MEFTTHEPERRLLKLMLLGDSDHGKTMTALELARRLVPGRWMILDNQGDQIEKFVVSHRLNEWADRHHATVDEAKDLLTYEMAIQQVEKSDHVGLIIDGFHFFWYGVLDHVNKEAHRRAIERQKPGKELVVNTVDAWQDSPGGQGGNTVFSKTLNRLSQCKKHVIVTVRLTADTQYVDGQWRQVGKKPIFRSGQHMYEFELVGLCEKSGSKHVINFDLKYGLCLKLKGRNFYNTFPIHEEPSEDGMELLDIPRRWMERSDD